MSKQKKFHVYWQQDGLTAEHRGTFDSREEALEFIRDMGGLMNETLWVPGDGPEDEDTETYNLGAELNCPIAFIRVY